MLRADIQTALDDGWSRRAIWTTLFDEKRITIQYHAFLRYLRRAGIFGPQIQEPPISVRPAAPPTGTGFSFNRRPNEQDLA